MREIFILKFEAGEWRFWRRYGVELETHNTIGMFIIKSVRKEDKVSHVNFQFGNIMMGEISTVLSVTAS